MRSTRLCRPSMGKDGANRLFRKAFTLSVPQVHSTTQRMSHGSHALMSSLVLGGAPCGLGSGRPTAELSWMRSAGEVQIVAGCHTARKARSNTRQITAEPMEAIQG